MSRPRLCLGGVLGFFLQSNSTTTRRKTPACLGLHSGTASRLRGLP